MMGLCRIAAMEVGMPEDIAPEWFQNAIDHPRVETWVTCGDIQVRALHWQNPAGGGIPMIALHGGMAHADWWRFIAPQLLPKYDVVAIDLSGHGLSDRRPDYHFDYWIEEVCATARHFFGDQPVVLFGHSMGGLLSVKTAAKYPERWRGIIISDSPLHRSFGRRNPDEDQPLFIKREYPDFETALKRFRLLPGQPITHPYIFRFLAESSLTQDDQEQWTWKFDPALFKSMRPVPFAQDLARLTQPMWFMRAAQSEIVPSKTRRALAQHCRNPWRWIQIENAYHHIMLDQPELYVETVLSLDI
jgi:pimeloyl-ACP methyl ester carboxylesterase